MDEMKEKTVTFESNINGLKDQGKKYDKIKQWTSTSNHKRTTCLEITFLPRKSIKAGANADELKAFIPEAKKELLATPEYTAMREALLEQYKAWHTAFWPEQ